MWNNKTMKKQGLHNKLVKVFVVQILLISLATLLGVFSAEKPLLISSLTSLFPSIIDRKLALGTTMMLPFFIRTLVYISALV